MASTLSTRLIRTHPQKLFAIWAILIGTLSLSSCKKSYTNKEVYTIKVGETFSYYFTNNSCCGECWNTDELNNVVQLTNNFIEASEGDCAGCSVQYSAKFKGLKEGTDTVKLHVYAMSRGCDLESENAIEFIVHVRK